MKKWNSIGKDYYTKEQALDIIINGTVNKIFSEHYHICQSIDNLEYSIKAKDIEKAPIENIREYTKWLYKTGRETVQSFNQ